MVTGHAPQAVAWTSHVPLRDAGDPNETGGSGDFRLELAVTEPRALAVGAPLSTPFLALCDTGRFSRVLLARLAGPGGGTVRFLAVKLQRDQYRPHGAQVGAVVNNREIDDMWRREVSLLERLAGRGVPMVLAFGPERGVLPPMAYDRKTGAIFPIVCPRTWRPLVTCRDDAVLRDAGLEPWSSTTARYFAVPARAAAHADGSPTFYTWSADDGKQAKVGVVVRRRHELYADLVASWALLQDGGKQQVRRTQPGLAAVLAELADGDGAAGIEARIMPLNYYESWLVVTAMQDVHFDEYCDLAGGATVEEAFANAEPSGRTLVGEGLRQAMRGENQWQSAPWTTAQRLHDLAEEPLRLVRFAREAAWLKLHAFVQVCRIVQQLHSLSTVPHLGLSSDNIMLRHVGATLPAPARWCFETTLIDLAASHRVVLEGVGSTERIGTLAVPATDAVRSFLSPWLAAGEQVRSLAMHATAQLAEVDGAPCLCLALRSARQRLDGVQPGDAVRIEPTAALPGTGERALLARVERTSKDGVDVVVDLAGVSGLPAQAYQFTATATFHRRLGTPCDLFSLGMLLARAMLVHDERDVFAVRESWDHLIDRAETMLGGAAWPAPERVMAVLQGMIHAEREAFDSSSVVWSKALRERLRAAPGDALPSELWQAILMLIAKLLTGFPGFSFAAHHGDARPGQPAAALDAVVGEAEELLASLHIEFADAAARDAEIADLAGSLLAKATAAMVEQGGAR